VRIPKFKKSRRKGDLRHSWEYQGWLIHSSSSGMYNMVSWFANKDDKNTMVNSNLNGLCVSIDDLGERHGKET